jgi:DNA-binding phage protein
MTTSAVAGLVEVCTDFRLFRGMPHSKSLSGNGNALFDVILLAVLIFLNLFMQKCLTTCNVASYHCRQKEQVMQMSPLNGTAQTARKLGMTRQQLIWRVKSGNPLWAPSHDLNPGGLRRSWAWSEQRIAEIRAQLTIGETASEGAK